MSIEETASASQRAALEAMGVQRDVDGLNQRLRQRVHTHKYESTRQKFPRKVYCVQNT